LESTISISLAWAANRLAIQRKHALAVD